MNDVGEARTATASTARAVIFTDDEGRVVGLDGPAQDTLGLEPGDAFGRTLPELLAPDGGASGGWRHLHDLLSGRIPAQPWQRLRLEAARAAGERTPVELTIAPAAEAEAAFEVHVRPTAARDVEQREVALLDAVEEVAHIGTWEWSPDSGAWWWSDNAFRLLGLHPGEIEPSLGYVAERCHPDDRERLVARLNVRGWPDGLEPMEEFRLLMPNDRVRHLLVAFAVVEERDDRPWRLLGTVRDITERRRAEREIAAHVAVAEALSEWHDLGTGGERLLAGLGAAMGFAAGVLWVPEHDELAPRVVWSTIGGGGRGETANRVRLRRGVGLPGQAWARREPAHLADLRASGASWGDPRAAAATEMGVRGGIAIPAVDGREVLAVIELASREEAEVTERLMRSLTGIGHEMGHFLSRRRGELEAPVLTAREIEVLALAAEGLPARRTAERLVVSHATIRTHFDNIYAKLGVSDKAAAVATAMRLGLID